MQPHRWTRRVFDYVHRNCIRTRWSKRLQHLSRRYGFYVSPVKEDTGRKWAKAVKTQVRLSETDTWRRNMEQKATLRTYREHKQEICVEPLFDNKALSLARRLLRVNLKAFKLLGKAPNKAARRSVMAEANGEAVTSERFREAMTSQKFRKEEMATFRHSHCRGSILQLQMKSFKASYSLKCVIAAETDSITRVYEIVQPGVGAAKGVTLGDISQREGVYAGSSVDVVVPSDCCSKSAST
ncbi:hypothetical protein MTO96_031015 [Rhipicephalus appendiculatus]